MSVEHDINYIFERFDEYYQLLFDCGYSEARIGVLSDEGKRLQSSTSYKRKEYFLTEQARLSKMGIRFAINFWGGNELSSPSTTILAHFNYEHIIKQTGIITDITFNEEAWNDKVKLVISLHNKKDNKSFTYSPLRELSIAQSKKSKNRSIISNFLNMDKGDELTCIGKMTKYEDMNFHIEHRHFPYDIQPVYSVEYIFPENGFLERKFLTTNIQGDLGHTGWF